MLPPPPSLPPSAPIAQVLNFSFTAKYWRKRQAGEARRAGRASLQLGRQMDISMPFVLQILILSQPKVGPPLNLNK